ncbi:MAG: ArnT family glycosyltransferase [Desulfococcaceae bacterium]
MTVGRIDEFAGTAEIFSLWKISRTAWLVIGLGFVLRMYLFFRIPLINPDGFLYIQQAKALYYGLSDSLTDCYEYLSNYPLFIVIGYKICGDWVIAARCASLFFGTLMLIPMYLIFRRFFDESLSTATLLAFALIPPFVLVSSDVLRDPVYWFFSASGLFLFLVHMENLTRECEYTYIRSLMIGSLSCLCFLMGTWARIEGALFIIISAACLVIFRQRRRWFSLFSFLLPLLMISALGILYLYISHTDILALLKPERLLSRPAEFFSKYTEVRHHLKILADQEPAGFSPFFFPIVRNLIWLIALSALAVQIVETLFYVFFIILIIGIAEARPHIFRDSRLLYLSFLSLSALPVLYSQVIYNWAMTSRFTMLFLLPAFVFAGYGIEKISQYIRSRFQIRQGPSYIVLCILMIAAALPKTLMATYVKDKEVYEEIGRFIAEREKNIRPVNVAGAFKEISAISFYANLNYKGAPCFDEFCMIDMPNAPDIQTVRRQSCNYLMWDEKKWGNQAESALYGNFVRIREWHTARHGKMVLYEAGQ